MSVNNNAKGHMTAKAIADAEQIGFRIDGKNVNTASPAAKANMHRVFDQYGDHDKKDFEKWEAGQTGMTPAEVAALLS